MRPGLKTATATMALLAAATFAHAQGQDDKNKGPGAEGKPPAAAQPQAGDKAQPRAAQPENKMDGQKGAQDRTTDRPKSTEGPQRDKDRQKSAQPQERDADKQKSTQQQPQERDGSKRTENADQDKQRQKTGQQPDKDQPRRAEQQQRDMDKDKQKSTRGKDEPGDKSKTAEQPKEPKQGERLKVTEQQRTTVRDRIRQTRVEKTRINVNISVGTHIPRSVRLHTLPVTIVEFAPEYRGYSYIVLEDETIVIVHPTTYVIVDYIPASSQRAGTQHLVLSSDQMRFVYRSLSREPRAEIRARLALGAEVPRSVQLVVFPGDVVQRVPELDRYRYVVSDDGVLVVDPRSHEVVLVIDE